MAEADASEVYAGTALTEVVRATLIRAAREGWCVGVLDITSAFLQTPLWGITHAVYGLRQSPKLWGSFRDMTVKKLVVDIGGVPHHLRQGRVENTWWVLKAEGTEQIHAVILVIYVDDFMIVGEEATIHRVASTIKAVWRASEVHIARRGEPVRFLGMTIEVDGHGFPSVRRTT